MSENPQKFKVIDKRRFDEEGNEKSTETEEFNHEDLFESHAQVEATSDKLDSRMSNIEQNEAQKDEKKGEGISFASIVLSLTSQTLIHLGEVAGVPGAPIDLEAARNTIDVLDLLREKTKGNLTAEESELLENAVRSLKFKYVEVTNRFQAKKI
ncbi:MAG: DUF1844 domain-containing protein [Deltaproteobacteria bacterium]|nr:DUF1844 domain-containing protein [Deltaproteobacteria bacterium]MCX7953231.1 DUF1844 domain-containing protein [Deltaproteobacteria bacterium]